MQTILGELPWKFKAVELGVRYRKAREVPLPQNLPISDNEITGLSSIEIKRYTVGNLLDLWRREWAYSNKRLVTRDERYRDFAITVITVTVPFESR